MDFAGLAGVFADLTAQLHGDGDGAKAMLQAVEYAAAHVDGCDSASITVLHHDQPRTIGCSDPAALIADQLQYHLGEGPCLQTAEETTADLVTDLTREQRWPAWTAAVLEQTPVRGVLCLRLPADTAALNLFAHTPRALTADSLYTGAVFASLTSNLLAQYEAEDTAANLQIALDSSRQIGAAIGILMNQHKITEDQAFDLLRDASQRLHTKLRNIATDVLHTGTIPTSPRRRHN